MIERISVHLPSSTQRSRSHSTARAKKYTRALISKRNGDGRGTQLATFTSSSTTSKSPLLYCTMDWVGEHVLGSPALTESCLFALLLVRSAEGFWCGAIRVATCV